MLVSAWILWEEVTCQQLLGVVGLNVFLKFALVPNIHAAWLSVTSLSCFSRVGVKVWNEMSNEYKNLSKKSIKKRNKKSSSQYSRNWRFLYGAWWDNAKIQTQQNWIKLNQFYNIFRTLRNARIFFSPLQWTSAIFLFFYFSFFFFAYLFVLLCYISSFSFYFQCN